MAFEDVLDEDELPNYRTNSVHSGILKTNWIGLSNEVFNTETVMSEMNTIRSLVLVATSSKFP